MNSTNITARYSIEINEINDKLTQLKNKRIYEITHIKTDGSIEGLARDLLSHFDALLNKIQNGLPSREEILGREIARNLSDKPNGDTK